MAPKARARSKSVPKVPKAKAAVLVPAQPGTSIARRTASNQTSSSHDVASEAPIMHEQAPLPPTLTPEPAAAAKLECSAPDPAALLVGKIERLLRDCLSAARPDLRILEIAVLDARHFPGISPELLAQAEERLEDAQEDQRQHQKGLADEPEAVLERLFDAISDGELDTVQRCLDANSGGPFQLEVDVVDHQGNTPLSEAACYGEVAIVEHLLKQRAHPDSQSHLGRTPLWRACYNGHAAVIELLLKSGADKSIANTLGEEPGKYGTPESKSLVSGWDPAITSEIRERVGLKALSKSWEAMPPIYKRWGKANDSGGCAMDRQERDCLVDVLLQDKGTDHKGEDLVRRFSDHLGLANFCPQYPIKITLKELHNALQTAHKFGKVPLVVCNGLDQPDRFLLYSCECIVDAKQIVAEVYFHKTKSLAAIHEELKHKLLATMETHGVGLGLHVRMGDSACDFTKTFCSPGMFPAEVFGGPARWNDHVLRAHFPDPRIIIQPDFRVVLTSSFSLEEASFYLASSLPFFEDMALIEVDGSSLC